MKKERWFWTNGVIRFLSAVVLLALVVLAETALEYGHAKIGRLLILMGTPILVWYAIWFKRNTLTPQSVNQDSALTEPPHWSEIVDDIS